MEKIEKEKDYLMRKVYPIYQRKESEFKYSIDYNKGNPMSMFPEPKEEKEKQSFNTYQELNKKIKEHLLIPLMNLFHKECSKEFFTKATYDDKAYNNDNKSEIKDYLCNECITIPVYDTYIHGVGYGTVQSFYVFYRKESRKNTTEMIKENGKNITEMIKEVNYIIEDQWQDIVSISDYIFLSNLFQITEENIKRHISYSFIDYFFQIINDVQDWESIWIMKEVSPTLDYNDFSEDNITYHWRKKFNKNKRNYDWIDCKKKPEEAPVQDWESIWIEEPEEGNKDLGEHENFNKSEYFVLPIRSISPLIKEEDKVGNINYILNHYIIFKYPTVTIFPDEKNRKLFEHKIRDKQTRVLERAIIMWYQHREIDVYNKLATNAKQMAHNLHHALDAVIRKELLPKIQNAYPEEEIGETIIKKDYFEMVENNSQNSTNTILDCLNLFLYIEKRCADNAGMHIDNTDKITNFKNFLLRYFVFTKWEKVIGYYLPNKKFQPGLISFLRKYLTANSDSEVDPKVELEYLGTSEERVIGKVEQALCVFLENYLRNVVKHNGAKGDIVVYIKIDEASPYEMRVQLWEKSEKWTTREIKMSREIFYERYENLREKHEKITEGSIFKSPQGGLYEMQIAADRLLFSKESNLNVKPVLTDGENTVRLDRSMLDREAGNQYPFLSMMYEFNISKFPQKMVIVLSDEFFDRCRKHYEIDEYGYHRNGIFICNLSEGGLLFTGRVADSFINLHDKEERLFERFYFIVNENDSTDGNVLKEIRDDQFWEDTLDATEKVSINKDNNITNDSLKNNDMIITINNENKEERQNLFLAVIKTIL